MGATLCQELPFAPDAARVGGSEIADVGADQAVLALQFLDQPSQAIGHGNAVHVEKDERFALRALGGPVARGGERQALGGEGFDANREGRRRGCDGRPAHLDDDKFVGRMSAAAQALDQLVQVPLPAAQQGQDRGPHTRVHRSRR